MLFEFLITWGLCLSKISQNTVLPRICHVLYYHSSAKGEIGLTIICQWLKWFIDRNSDATLNWIWTNCAIAMWCKQRVQILILAFTMMRSNAMSQPLLNVQNGQNKPNMEGVTRFEPTDRICAGRAKCMKDFVYTHFTVLHSCDMQ